MNINKKIKEISKEAKLKLQHQEYSSASPWYERSKTIDAFISQLSQNMITEGICLVAIGGYGRAEVFPHSDIDIAVITDSMDSRFNDTIRCFADSFWNAGITPSIFAGTPEEIVTASKHELERLTACLDHRLISGDKKIYHQFSAQFKQTLEGSSPIPFIKAKLSERDQNHKKHGNSRYCVEPNVKFGKGGLRDIHALYWILKRIDQVQTLDDMFKSKVLSAPERTALKEAYVFLRKIRWALHQRSNRATDTLTLDNQIEVAKSLDIKAKTPQKAAEKMMGIYFKHARAIGQITRHLCAFIEEKYIENKITQAQKTFNKDSLPPPLTIKGHRLSLHAKKDLDRTPGAALDVFLVAQKKGLTVHPEVFRWIREKKNSLKTALAGDSPVITDILTGQSPEKTLRRIHEAGLLDVLLPEFSHLNGLMQFDGYHAYTADEHIFTAVGILAALIDKQEFEYLDLKQSPALMTAMLFHDIGKGQGGDHEEKGAEILLSCAKRLGLNDETTSLAVFLVKNSGYMAEVTFKRDIEDPKTIEDFCKRIQTIARLRMLYAITLADSLAVGKSYFTNWKDQALKRTYKLAYNYLSGYTALGDDTPIPDEGIELQSDKTLGATRVRIYTEDRLGLFRDLCGAMALADTRIIRAKIKTLDNRMALDEFYIQTPNQQPVDYTDHLGKHLRSVLDNEFKLDDSHPLLEESYSDIPTIIFDNDASHTSTLMEVSVADGRGLLYILASCLTDLKIQVISAQINTFRGRAIDVFYIRDRYGMKITEKHHQEKIRKHITASLC